MAKQTGSLSINSENIFPIIKKWLYSDHDIFYRELISNSCDAITKLKKLDIMGEYELPKGYTPSIFVELDPEKKTIKITDNGLGMDESEVNEYINQIAFSGASDFLEKYKDKANEDQIIGHFGLGFYSAFMVADKVCIDTLSFKEKAAPVHWECDGGTEFSMDVGKKEDVGTSITLFLNEDTVEFCNEYRAKEVLDKYCSFMPYPIILTKVNDESTQTISKDEKLDTDEVIETLEDDKLKIKKRPLQINDPSPLWAKTPSECTDDEYKEFYRKVFNDFKEPLFWIHLNMDYPFNLKGILYFPKINMEYESIEGTIKLYNNQVFIADNIKEVIPEFLLLLKGAIDCPDLPLNVSRSALQNDGFVKKISEYITKKVADKLIGMSKTDRENYEKYWDDISPFIKFGCLRDEKFCDKMSDYVLFKDLEGKYKTLPDLLPEVETDDKTKETTEDKEAKEPEENNNSEEDKEDKEANETTLYYVTDQNTQGQYIKAFKDQELNAIILDSPIDTNYIAQLEMRNENLHFTRIDAGINDSLSADSDEDLGEITNSLTDIFKKSLKNENLKVEVKILKDDSISSLITVSESSRRMADMMRMYSAPGIDSNNMFPKEETLVLNAGNELVKFILNNSDNEHVDDFCNQLYDLACIANEPLSPDKMDAFIKRSNKIMLLLSK